MDTGVLPKPIPFGKYCLLEKISVGGMAEVYKAKAFGVEGFERLLAVKKILNSIAEDETFISMFIDEAKIAGQLNHPNIAQIFDLGKVDGSYFIALEYVSGRDLRTVWDRFVRDGVKPDIFLACHIIMKVCEALQYAHTKKDASGQDLNIVHRDISPHNILVSYEGDAKIIDFGIAKAQGKSSQTQVGILKGKFSYMSPEQVRGLHIDHRADLFSLGIVLYELLTHERLFLGESDFDTLEKIRKVEMSPPTLYNPHIPRELEDIVLKTLAKSPDDRFQNGSELYDALERFMRNQGSFFASKDLAAVMKKTFATDIELERKKLDYYRSINLESITQQANGMQANAGRMAAAGGVAMGGGAAMGWDDNELNTNIYGRGGGPAPGGGIPLPASPNFNDINPAAEFAANNSIPPGGYRNGGAGAASYPGSEADIVYKTGEVAVPVGGIMPGLPGVDDLVDGLDDDELDDPTMEFDRWQVGNALTPQIVEAAPPEPPMMSSAQVSSNSMRAVDRPPLPQPPAAPKPPPPTPQAPDIFGGPPEPAKPAPPPHTVAPSRDDKKGGSGAIVAVILILVLVLGGGSAAYYFLVLKGSEEAAVTFKVEGADKVEIYIDDNLKHSGATDADIVLAGITPGSRNITIKADGYLTKTDSLNVTSGQQYILPIEMKKAPEVGKAAISVKVEPSDTTVTLNGEKVEDEAPFSKRDLKPGKYEVVFKKDGFLEEKRSLEIGEGKTEELDIKMRPSRVALVVKPTPSDAEVTLYIKESKDAERKKLKSAKGELKAEDLDATKFYEIETAKKGFAPTTEPFEPGVDKEKTLLPKLAAESSGDTGDDKAAADLAAKQEERRKRMAERIKERNKARGKERGGDNGGGGRVADNTPKEKDPPEKDKVKAPVDNTPGVINVNSRPAAKVIIDGKDTGRYTPLINYKISPGPHRVTLKNPEKGLNKTYNINIKPGGSRSILHLPK